MKNKKMLIVCLVFVFVFVLFGCANKSNNNAKANSNSNFIVSREEKIGVHYIYSIKDKDTGVCYIAIASYDYSTVGSSITPLYNADGTLKTYKTVGK